MLIVDEDKKEPPCDTTVRANTLRWAVLQEAGWGEANATPEEDNARYEHIERRGEQTELAISEVAEEVGADVVVVAAMSVHSRAVDANLLAEFVSCPLLVVP